MYMYILDLLSTTGSHECLTSPPPPKAQELTRAARTPDGREEAVGVADGTLTFLVTCKLKQLPLLLVYPLQERHNGAVGVRGVVSTATEVESGYTGSHTYG